MRVESSKHDMPTILYRANKHTLQKSIFDLIIVKNFRSHNGLLAYGVNSLVTVVDTLSMKVGGKL